MFNWVMRVLRRGDNSDSIEDRSTSENNSVLEDGLLGREKYNRSDITFNRLYNKLTSPLRGVYGDELDEVIDQDSVSDPSDMIIGKAIWKIIAVMAIALPVFAFTISTGSVIPDPGLFTIVFGALVSSLLLGIVMLLGWLLLATQALNDRGTRIETVLPEAMSFMYAQSKSEVNYLNVIRSIALAEDAYGPVSKEFQTIVRRCEYFGEDVETAIEKQAQATPSAELQRILTGLKSHIENGADVTDFFEREAESARERIERKESASLDLYDMIATLYMVVSLAPILLFATVVGFATFAEVPTWVYAGIAYIVTPAVTLFFIYLVGKASTDRNQLDTLTDFRDQIANSVFDTSDEDGYTSTQRTLSTAFGKEDKRIEKGSRIEAGRSKHIAADGVFETERADEMAEYADRFTHISDQATRIRIYKILTNPVEYLIEKPVHVLFISIPLTAILLEPIVFSGVAPTFNTSLFVESPEVFTLYWVVLPATFTFGPLALFYQVKKRRERKIQKAFPDTLQKIVNTEESGASLTNSINNVAENKTNILDEEMEIVAAKTQLGMPLDRSLVELNNVYNNPQVTRGTRLLIEAYRASSHITDVLEETIESARLSLKIADEKRRQTQLQMLYITLIVGASSVILFVVSSFFVDLAQEGLALDAIGDPQAAIEEGEDGGASPVIMNMTIFHAAFLNSFLGGMFIGYISDQTLMNGIKYALGLSALTVGIWVI